MKSRLLAIAGIVTVMLIGSGIGGAIVTSRNALASRNSSGTYSLFAGTTPVVSFQTVGSSLWNNAWNDMAADMTNSLDRNGRGGMLAALRGTDGSVSAPAFSFTSEPGSGLYRIGAGDLGWAISGGKKLELTSALFTVTPDGLFSGKLGVGAAASVALHNKGTVAAGGIVDTRTENTSNAGYSQFSLANDGGATVSLFFGGSVVTTPGDRNLLGIQNTAGSISLRGGGTAEVLRVASGGVTIGATGTAISARYRGTTSWTPGSVAASTSTVKAITVTGAAAGADCRVTPPNAVGAFTSWCVVTADTCTVTIYNTLASGPSSGASGTWSCVVENP